MCFSFDYVIKEMVNAAPVQPPSYGCTWEVLRSTQEAKVASFVLSNLPRGSITRWLHAARLPLLKYIYIYI